MIVQEKIEMVEVSSSTRNKNHKSNFGKLVVDTIDTVFSSLGESCREAVYFHMKNAYGISREDIPLRIDDFADALEGMFGPGSKLIEIEIMKLLFSKVPTFKFSLKQEPLVFRDYLNRLRVS